MRPGRVLSLAGALAVVAALVTLVAVMASAAPKTDAKDTFSAPTTANGGPVQHSSPSPTSVPSPVATPSATPTPTPAPTAAPAAVATKAPAAPAPTVKPVPPAAAPAPAGGALPLALPTGDATQVITVKASSSGSTTATVQAWNKAPGGWVAQTGPVTAHIGSQGMTTAPSESKSATPMGSFTLTQAFGNNTNPGTRLPYHKVVTNDYWISDVGSGLYNTMQNGAQYGGGANEALWTIWQYGYAVNIDYNTYPATKGAGSAFFLHITDGGATAGCVAIPQANLVAIMQWLNPAAHPRILIGTR